MKKLYDVNSEEYKKYMKAEIAAYRKLIDYGYTPQGRTNDFKQVVVFKIKNIESKEVFYFDSW